MQAQLAIALAIVASLVVSCQAAEFCSSEDVPLWQAYIMEATWGNSSQVGRPCLTGDVSDFQELYIIAYWQRCRCWMLVHSFDCSLNLH